MTIRSGWNEADAAWTELRECRWAHAGGALVKVAITPAVVPALDAAAEAARKKLQAVLDRHPAAAWTPPATSCSSSRSAALRWAPASTPIRNTRRGRADTSPR